MSPILDFYRLAWNYPRKGLRAALVLALLVIFFGAPVVRSWWKPAPVQPAKYSEMRTGRR